MSTAQTASNGADSVVKSLSKNFRIVGTQHVHQWYAWAVLGLVTGMLAMVMYVANRSAQFSSSLASTSNTIKVYLNPFPGANGGALHPGFFASSAKSKGFIISAANVSWPPFQRDDVEFNGSIRQATESDRSYSARTLGSYDMSAANDAVVFINNARTAAWYGNVQNGEVHLDLLAKPTTYTSRNIVLKVQSYLWKNGEYVKLSPSATTGTFEPGFYLGTDVKSYDPSHPENAPLSFNAANDKRTLKNGLLGSIPGMPLYSPLVKIVDGNKTYEYADLKLPNYTKNGTVNLYWKDIVSGTSYNYEVVTIDFTVDPKDPGDPIPPSPTPWPTPMPTSTTSTPPAPPTPPTPQPTPTSTPSINGTVSISLSSNSAPTKHVIMGSTNNSLMTVRLTTDTSGTVINSLTFIDIIQNNSSTVSSFKNLSLYNGTTKISGPASLNMAADNNSAFVTLPLASPLQLSQYQTVSLELRGDVATFTSSGAVSGSIHTFLLQGGTTVSTNVTKVSGSAIGNAITVYRTNLSLSSSLTPGASATSRSRIGNENLATLTFAADAASALTVGSVKLTFSGNAVASGTTSFAVNIIDNDTTLLWGSSSQQTCTPTTSNTCTVTFSPNYTISAGSNKGITLRVDSSSFANNATTQDGLAVTIQSTSDVLWSDGTTPNIPLETSVVPFTVISVTYQ